MSIASQLQAYENGLTDSYNMVSQKGGTMPVHKNMSSLASSIATIPSGGGSSVGIPREVDADGTYRMPTQNFSFSLPSGAIAASKYALYGAFIDCTSLTSADLSSLTTVSGSSAFNSTFSGCTGLTSIGLSSLTTVSGSSAFSYAFSGCTGLTSIGLSSLTTVSGNSAFNYAFRNCTGLTSIGLSSLTTVSGSSAFSYAFSGCTGLTSVSFSALTTSSFGARTNQFNNMLSGCSNVTVHFPAAIQSTIGSWSSVTSGFGGTNTTVLFDL